MKAKQTPPKRPRATKAMVSAASLVRWLRKSERTSRSRLTSHPEQVPLFDRGYYLGQAHAYLDTRLRVQARAT